MIVLTMTGPESSLLSLSFLWSSSSRVRMLTGAIRRMLPSIVLPILFCLRMISRAWSQGTS